MKILMALLISILIDTSAFANCAGLLESRVEALAKAFVQSQQNNRPPIHFFKVELEEVLKEKPELRALFEERVAELLQQTPEVRRVEKKQEKAVQNTLIWKFTLDASDVYKFGGKLEKMNLTPDQNQMTLWGQDPATGGTYVESVAVKSGKRKFHKAFPNLSFAEISPNQKYISAINEASGHFHVEEIDTGKVLQLALNPAADKSYKVSSFSPDSTHVSHTYLDSIYVYDLAKPQAPIVLSMMGQPVFSNDNSKILLTRKLDSSLVDLKTPDREMIMKGKLANVGFFLPGDTKFVISTYDTIEMYDVSNVEKPLWVINRIVSGTTLTLISNELLWAFDAKSGKMHLFDVRDGSDVHMLMGEFKKQKFLSVGEKIYMFNEGDPQLKVYNLKQRLSEGTK